MPAFLNLAQQMTGRIPPGTKVPYPNQPPPGTPAAWTQPARGPMINGPMPPPEFGPHEGPHAPPPPPNPSLIPQAPQMPGPGQPPPSPSGLSGGQGPMPLGIPGGQMGPKLSDIPPGMGNPFAGVGEDTIKEIAGLGNMPDELQGLDSQISQAEALRYKPGPEGRDSGRVYTAANPMEHIGSLMQQYAQKRRLEGGPERLGGLIKAQTGLYNDRKAMLDKAGDTRKKYFDIVRGIGGQ